MGDKEDLHGEIGSDAMNHGKGQVEGHVELHTSESSDCEPGRRRCLVHPAGRGLVNRSPHFLRERSDERGPHTEGRANEPIENETSVSESNEEKPISIRNLSVYPTTMEALIRVQDISSWRRYFRESR